MIMFIIRLKNTTKKAQHLSKVNYVKIIVGHVSSQILVGRVSSQT